MTFASILALALGSSLLSCTLLYSLWTITRRERFKVKVLRIKKQLIADMAQLNGNDDAEYRHVIDCLDAYYTHPYLTSLPAFVYLSVVSKELKAECPTSNRADLRPALDRAMQDFVRQHLTTTFLECPTVLFLRAFLALFPKWARQNIEKDTQQTIKRSFNNADCENKISRSRGRMQLAGSYAQTIL